MATLPFKPNISPADPLKDFTKALAVEVVTAAQFKTSWMERAISMARSAPKQW